MKNLFSSLVLIALLLVLTLPLSPDTDDSNQVIAGRIMAENSVPVAGVTVLGSGVSSTTDLKGWYKLQVPKSRHYSVTMTKSGMYKSFHTFSHTDLESSAIHEYLNVPTIVMVQRKSGRVMFAFAGDTMLARRYLNPLTGEPVLIRPSDRKSDMKKIARLAKPYLELADFTSVNLETQLSTDPGLTPIPKSVTFITHPDIVPVLQDAGVDYVALGNNHTFDYAGEGLHSTLSTLDNYGLSNSGAGINEAYARRPAVVELGKQKYSFLSYVGWSGGFSPNQVAGPDKGGAALGLYENLMHDLRAIRNSATSILQVHSGLEYHAKPSLSEVTRYKAAIEAGADLVLGHHPHVLQGFDLYRNRFIGYSLGNFLFDQYIYATQSSMILYVWMDGDQFHRAEVVPMFLNGYVPTPASGEIRFDILQRLMHLSNQSNLAFSPSGAHGVIVPRSTSIKLSQLEASSLKRGVVAHLDSLGLAPMDNIGSVVNADGAYRLGVDLIKRGSFETSGEYGIIDRSWITANNITVVGDSNRKLRIVGPARTGMKTFDRVFSVSNPATISASIVSSGKANVIFYIQRRKMNESRNEALKTGALQEIGRRDVVAGQVNVVNLDFNMPRASSKGVRLLIDILQTDKGVVDIDELTWVEWNTPWLGDDGFQYSPALQATHIQVQEKPTP